MFANIKRVSTKTANALDLIIDFATLGEYGPSRVSLPPFE
jgi:hypothetical protein